MSMKNNNIDPKEIENEEWANEILRYLEEMNKRLKNIEERINVRDIDSRAADAFEDDKLSGVALNRILDEYLENQL